MENPDPDRSNEKRQKRPTVCNNKNGTLVAVDALDSLHDLPRTRTGKHIAGDTRCEQTSSNESDSTRLMAGTTTANKGNLGRVVVCSVDDLLGGDQGKIRVRGNETSDGSKDQGLVVWEDVSVCHCCERNEGWDREEKSRGGERNEKIVYEPAL